MSVEEYFRGKGCVVTGAASGIGFAVSEALLNVGAVVCMSDWNTEMLTSAVEQLSAHAGRLHSATVDVSKQEQVQKLIQDAAARHGRLDVLFNNAGIGFGGSIWDVTLDMWRRLIDINLWGVIYGVHAALPIMRSQGGGHIVNTASIWGLLPGVYESIYCTTKHAVVGLSEALRYELEPEGISVSAVCPGGVATGIFPEGKAPADAIPAADFAQMMLAGVANREGVIVAPEQTRLLWREFSTSPETFEDKWREFARMRREAYLSQQK
jgi:NAD(P)-dependent dehydrogenase (short-subunit alcohol dehydrogenase family)